MPQQDPGGGGDLPPAPEPGSKAPRGGGGPPGGGPGGGPFGGPGSSFGGGGLNPQVFRLLAGLGEQVPIMVKRRGINIPGLTPGPPGRTDTVPAMLSPGEQVMSNGAQQMNPDLAMQVMQANMQAAPQGYEHGGQVPGQFCPHCGMPHGQAQGYAYGGVAGGFTGLNTSGLNRNPTSYAYGQQPTGGGAGAQPAAGGLFGGGGPWQQGQGMLRILQQKQNPANPPGGGMWGGQYTYDKRGGVSNFNPNDPFGSQAGSRDPNAFGAAERTLGGFGQAGYFDPSGNQMLLNAMNEGAQGTADALVRRQVSQADLGGLDPAQRAVAKLQALRETGRGVQDIMANTRGQVLGDQNEFAQNLFNQLFQQNAGWYGAQQQGDINRWLQNEQEQNAKKNQWGNIAGGVLGSATGGYLSGRGR